MNKDFKTILILATTNEKEYLHNEIEQGYGDIDYKMSQWHNYNNLLQDIMLESNKLYTKDSIYLIKKAIARLHTKTYYDLKEYKHFGNIEYYNHILDLCDIVMDTIEDVLKGGE